MYMDIDIEKVHRLIEKKMGKDEAERRFEACDQRMTAVERGVRGTKIESQRFEVRLGIILNFFRNFWITWLSLLKI